MYKTIGLVEYSKYNWQKNQMLPTDYSSNIIQMYVMLDMEIFTLSKFLFMANCSYEYQHILWKMCTMYKVCNDIYYLSCDDYTCLLG